jgi:hypothetical protein
VAFKWENNEHGVPIATRDDDGRKPSQTRQTGSQTSRSRWSQNRHEPVF